MAAIEVMNLVKQYGQRTALGGVSFSVEEGETFGYLGPNGAGKTTTIRILTGMTQATSGTARILSHDIRTDTIGAKRYIGVVPETSNVYDDLSAWHNLIFNAELYGVPDDTRNAAAKRLLDLFDLFDRKDDKVRGFSKGMKRRLTIAMGLVNDPKILFLDEPTSGLDIQSNLIIRDVIRELADRGVTVFLTTHNIEEANVTCRRVAIINHGRIAAIDSPERLKGTFESVKSLEVGLGRITPAVLTALRTLPLVNDLVQEGDKVRLLTHDPIRVLDKVREYTSIHGIPVLSVSTLGPSLEDVFIRITGVGRRAKEVQAID
jgi:ABC-2 type transport system ATP-binding protein